MRAVWETVSTLLFVFFVLLIGRLILDWVRVFARDWRPTGVVLVVPPLRLLRRVIPPLTVGGLRIDLAFLALFFLTSTLMGLVP